MRKNILALVDTMYSVGNLIEYLLNDKLKDMFTIIIEDNFNTALERLSMRDIDIIMVNSRQPAGYWPGTGCTEIIKQIKLLYNIPLLAISEFKDWDKEQEYKTAGADCVIRFGDEEFKQLPYKIVELLKGKWINRE